jgi:hypothetical protein
MTKDQLLRLLGQLEDVPGDAEVCVCDYVWTNDSHANGSLRSELWLTQIVEGAQTEFPVVWLMPDAEPADQSTHAEALAHEIGDGLRLLRLVAAPYEPSQVSAAE